MSTSGSSSPGQTRAYPQHAINLSPEDVKNPRFFVRVVPLGAQRLRLTLEPHSSLGFHARRRRPGGLDWSDVVQQAVNMLLSARPSWPRKRSRGVNHVSPQAHDVNPLSVMRQPPVACVHESVGHQVLRMTITVGDGAELGHDVPERFRKLDAQQSSDIFEDEHGRKMDFQVVDNVPDGSARWICEARL